MMMMMMSPTLRAGHPASRSLIPPACRLVKSWNASPRRKILQSQPKCVLTTAPKRTLQRTRRNIILSVSDGRSCLNRVNITAWTLRLDTTCSCSVWDEPRTTFGLWTVNEDRMSPRSIKQLSMCHGDSVSIPFGGPPKTFTRILQQVT